MGNYTLKYTGEKVDELLEKIDTAFGETTTVIGNALTWDGSTDGLYSVMDILYRVSGATPSLEDLQAGGTITMNMDGVENIIEFTGDDVEKVEDIEMGTDALMIGEYIVVALADGATIIPDDTTVIALSKAGVYFSKADFTSEGTFDYTSAFTINNYTFVETEVKPIDIKYLPESHQFGETTVTTETALFEEFKCDGQVSGWYSEHNFPDDFKLAIFDTEKSYKLIVNGDEYFGNYREQDSYINFENIMVGESAFTIQVYSNGNTTGVASVNIHRDEGCLDPSYDFTLSLYEITTKKIVRKLSKKYLPDNIGGGGGVCVTVDFMTGKASMTSTEIATALSNGNYVFGFMEVEEGQFMVARVVAVAEIGEGFGLAAVLMVEMIDMDGGGMMQMPAIITEDGSLTMMS